MRKIAFAIALILFVICTKGETKPDSLKFGPFGVVKIYKPSQPITSVALFISGDGGWNTGVIDMTKHVTDEGGMVVGIDIWSYYRALRKSRLTCYYPAGDLEQLSMMIQKRYGLDKYYKPILIGYSSGATLVYGALAQAPENTFSGAIALGFCPDIEISRPLCKGSGLNLHVLNPGKSFSLEPCKTLTEPFIALLGNKDEICNFSDVKAFMKEVKKGELIELSRVGHGFSVSANWLPQFKAAYKKMDGNHSVVQEKPSTASIPGTVLSDHFPIKIIFASTNESLPFVFMISGDGGWTNFDNSIARTLSEQGVNVIGLDAQKYFWKAKTPQETAKNIATTVRYYMKAWKINKFALVGYSFGACIVPTIANEIPSDLKFSLSGVYCLSPDKYADFEIHIAEFIHLNSDKGTFFVPDEIKKIRTLHPVCIFGDKENKDLRTEFSTTGAKVFILHGDHHYNNNTSGVAATIVKDIKESKE